MCGPAVEGQANRKTRGSERWLYPHLAIVIKYGLPRRSKSKADAIGLSRSGKGLEGADP